MIPKIVASTLAALNSIVAPFGSNPSTLADSYRFDVKSAPTLATACLAAGAQPSLQMKVEEAGSLTVRIRVQSRLCGLDHRTHNASAQFILPLDVFDTDFMKNLGERRPYILTGIEDPEHLELRTRMKVTRLPIRPAGTEQAPGSKDAAGTQLTEFSLEWVADSAQSLPLHPPVTIWLKTDVKTAALQTFPWEKFEFTMEPRAATAKSVPLAASAPHAVIVGRTVAGLTPPTALSGPDEGNHGRLTAELHAGTRKAKTLR